MTGTTENTTSVTVSDDRPLGIIGAMPGEVGSIVAALEQAEPVIEHGRRVFARGRIGGRPVVVAGARVGKVAAAATATELIVRFGVVRLVFTGVAGGLGEGLGIGDVVVADRLIQHDLDASPLFPACEVPLLGVSAFEADPDLLAGLLEAARGFLDEDLRCVVPADVLERLHVRTPSVSTGLIATGDVFVASAALREMVLRRTPAAACVEMEGAAVAQVAHEYGVPFGVVRTISDAADDHAAAAFPESLDLLAGAYGVGIVRRLLAGCRATPGG